MSNKLFETDSEEIVLASILQSPELIHSVDGLRSYMFSSTATRTIFEEFEDLVDKGNVPAVSLVHNSLEAKKILGRAGGKRYIEILAGKDVHLESFSEMVRLVIASYKARQIISITSSIEKDKLSSANVDDYIYNLRKNIDGLMGVTGENDTVLLGDIVLSVFEEINERRKAPGIRGFSWGIAGLDKATGGKCGGDLIAIAGRPGMGKTALVMNSILADGRNGIPSLLIEREMRKQELTERLISIDTGIPNSNLRLGMLDQDQMDLVKESLMRLKKMPIYIDTSFKSKDPYYIEGVVNKYKNKYGIETVYLDYIQLATERDERQTQEIGKMTRMFKLLANDLGICGILLSQLNRNVEARDIKKPMLSDMKQSGSIEEDSDFVIGLYRDEVYTEKDSKYKGLLDFIILKYRNGPTGTVVLKFDGPTNKISDVT